MALPSRYTGQPLGAAPDSSIVTTSPSSTQTSVQSGGTQTVSGGSSQSSSGVNTTPEVLQALSMLMGSLTGQGAQAGPIPARYAGQNGQAILQTEIRNLERQIAQMQGGSTPRLNAFPTNSPATTFYGPMLQQLKQLQGYQAQLSAPAGGTAGTNLLASSVGRMQQTSEERQAEIDRNQARVGDFSREAAIADSQNTANYWSRVLGEKLLSPIARAAEGAGTSAGSMRALLALEAGQRANEQASQQSLGHIQNLLAGGNQLSSVLEALTRPTMDPVAQTLLSAISASKGLVESRNAASSTSQTTQNDSFQDSNQYSSGGQVTKLPYPDTTYSIPYQGATANPKVGDGGGVIIRTSPRTEDTSQWDSYTEF